MSEKQQSFECDTLVTRLLPMLNEFHPKVITLADFRPRLMHLFHRIRARDENPELVDRRTHDFLYALSFSDILSRKQQAYFDHVLMATDRPDEFPILCRKNIIQRIYFELVIYHRWLNWFQECLIESIGDFNRSAAMIMLNYVTEFANKSDLELHKLCLLLGRSLMPFWIQCVQHGLDASQLKQLLIQIKPALERSFELNLRKRSMTSTIEPFQNYIAILFYLTVRPILTTAWTTDQPPACLFVISDVFGKLHLPSLNDEVLLKVNEQAIWLEAKLRYHNLTESDRAEMFERIGLAYDERLNTSTFTETSLMECSALAMEPGSDFNLVQLFVSQSLLHDRYCFHLLPNLHDLFYTRQADFVLKTIKRTRNAELMIRFAETCLRSALPVGHRSELMKLYFDKSQSVLIKLAPIPFDVIESELKQMITSNETDAHYRSVLSYVLYEPFEFLMFLLSQCVGPNNRLLPLIAYMFQDPLVPLCEQSIAPDQPAPVLFALALRRLSLYNPNQFDKLLQLFTILLTANKQPKVYWKHSILTNLADHALFVTCLHHEKFQTRVSVKRTLEVLLLCLQIAIKNNTIKNWPCWKCPTLHNATLDFMAQIVEFLESNNYDQKGVKNVIDLIVRNCIEEEQKKLAWKSLFK